MTSHLKIIYMETWQTGLTFFRYVQWKPIKQTHNACTKCKICDRETTRNVLRKRKTTSDKKDAKCCLNMCNVLKKITKSNMWPNFQTWTVSTIGGDFIFNDFDLWQVHTNTNSLLVKLTCLRTVTLYNIYTLPCTKLHAAGKERVFWARSRSVALSSAASPPQNPFSDCVNLRFLNR